MLSPIRSSGSRLQGGAFRRLVRISAQAWAHLRYSPIRRGMSSVFTRNPAAEDRGAEARRHPIVEHMVVRVLDLSCLPATLHMQLTISQKVHACQPGDPKGYLIETAASH